MNIKEAKKQAKKFMENSGLLVSWNDILFAKNGNVKIAGVTYNIQGQRKIKL